MPTVRLRDASEYPAPIQKLFEVAKAWFNYDFAQPPAMSRVMAWDPEFGAFHGRAMKRAMTPGEIRAFYDRADVPVAFRRVAADPGYLADLWGAARRVFADNQLTRRHKEALAFAVSVTTRSAFGTAFHLGEMRRLGVGERGVMEVLGVTQMVSSYTKIADTLQLEPDMDGIAVVDPSPAPTGAAPGPTPRPPEAP